MLKEFELSLEILNDVLDEKTPFAEALRKQFQTHADIRPLRGQVAGLVGCELRHQIYFDYMTRKLEDFTLSERRLLCLVLANAFYYRRFDVDQTRHELLAVVGEEKMGRCQELIDLASTPENYIPADVDRKSPLYLSLRFNVPEWTVKIIAHFGGSATYNSLRKLSRQLTTTLRVRTSEVALARVFENPDYTSTPVNGIVFYKGNVPLRKIPEFQKGQYFPEKMLTKHIIDENLVADPGEVLLYNGNKDSSLERELIETYGANVGLNIATSGSVDEKIEVSKLIKAKGLKNVNFFSAPDPLNMEASVSRMAKLVLVSPESTNFDLIPTSPDYLLHFDTQKMDEIIDGEKKALEGCSKYVEEGGKLVYVVYTISKKEGRQNVSEFLKAHPEFTLVNDHQYFPHEELETAAYVAVLLKGEKELTISTPFAEISAPLPTTSAVTTPTATSK
ncbi:MAG: hypothetical protein K6E59_05985 [Bacilli bacterium]|nr:hypothetical protein [Bacilli bacterium]